MKSIHHSYTWAMVTLALLVIGFNVTAVRAQERPAPKTQETTDSKAQQYFTDTVLINQDGQRMRFYSDLMKDKTVIIDTFFATCQGTCLPMNRKLEQIQKALGD